MNNYFLKKKTVEWLQLPIEYVVKTTHIPPFQRMLNQEHVETIYNGLEEYYLLHHSIFLPGVISLGKYPNKNKCILLDGQHRLTALKHLSEKYDEVKNFLIRIDVYEVENDEEAYKIYHIINSNRQVELFDGDISRFVMSSLQKFMKDTYQDYCKSTKNPRGLNINLDEMAKYVQGYNLIEKLGVTLEDIDTTLFDRIVALNTFYQKQKPEMFAKWGIDDFTEKHKKYLEGNNNPFYLGLWRRFEWIEHLIDSKDKYFKDIDHNASDHEVKKRQKIPSSIREKVWQKRCGNLLTGECYVCGRAMKYKYDQFHCGHILSVKDGGTNTVDNLEPICSTCNLDMGSMHLETYKKLFN